MADNVLSILIASDIHLGYAEDPIRGDDSFNSFEEVLAIACEQRVDMVLLAGDLFRQQAVAQDADAVHAAAEGLLSRRARGED